MDAEGIFNVVINEEGQYSIWPEYKESLSPGWSATGMKGAKEDCLAHIDSVWTDMRPLSLRKKMEETPPSPDSGWESDAPARREDPRDDLVGFAMVGAALRVADQHISAAKLTQH